MSFTRIIDFIYLIYFNLFRHINIFKHALTLSLIHLVLWIVWLWASFYHLKLGCGILHFNNIMIFLISKWAPNIWLIDRSLISLSHFHTQFLFFNHLTICDRFDRYWIHGPFTFWIIFYEWVCFWHFCY